METTHMADVAMTTDYRCDVHGKIGCCSGGAFPVWAIETKVVKHCSCGSRMVRWHKQGPWICPRCGPAGKEAE